MTPVVITVDSPVDTKNPFPPDLRQGRPEGSTLAYHGTGKTSLDAILSNGFAARKDEELQSDIEQVFHASDEFEFGGVNRSGPGIPAVECLHSEFLHNDGLSRPFFSGSYVHARFYALYPGGEAVVGMLNFLGDFGRLASDMGFRDSHIRFLKGQLNRLDRASPEWRKLNGAIVRLGQHHLQDAWLGLNQIYNRYRERAEGEHVPVVVAVWAPPDTFLRPARFIGVNEAAVRPIPPSQILGVAILPAGSKPSLKADDEDWLAFLEEIGAKQDG